MVEECAKVQTQVELPKGRIARAQESVSEACRGVCVSPYTNGTMYVANLQLSRVPQELPLGVEPQARAFPVLSFLAKVGQSTAEKFAGWRWILALSVAPFSKLSGWHNGHW